MPEAVLSFAKLRSSVIESSKCGRSENYRYLNMIEQQRRGRLDLRALAQIDLEKIVRDVDIDSLQMHLENITYCNLREEDLRFVTDQHVVKLFRTSQLMIEYLLFAQEQLASNLDSLAAKYLAKKRALAKKRKEVAELLESTKHLKAGLRSKKKGLRTLEGLLQDGRTQNQRTSSVEAPSAKAVTKLYVSGPRGLCIEVPVRSHTCIRDIRREAAATFISKRDAADASLLLFYQGTVLRDDAAVSECGLRDGDTIMAQVEVETTEEKQEASAPFTAHDMMKFLSEQHRAMASEMKEYWERFTDTMLKMQPAPAPSDSNSGLVLGLMEEKWARMENSFRQQLDRQFDHLKKRLSEQETPSKLIVGELEDDSDYERVDTRMRTIEKKNEVTVNDMKDMLLRQSQSFDHLATLVARLSTDKPVPASAPAAPAIIVTEKPPPKIALEPSEPPLQRKAGNKWKQYAGSDTNQLERSGAAKKVEEITAIPEEKPVVKPAPLAVEAPPVTPQLPKRSASPIPTAISIVFSPQHSRDLAKMLRPNETISVRIPNKNMSPDDIIFEIRRVVSEKVDVPLSRVALSLNDKNISLGVDVDDTFTASAAAALAASGQLTILITKENVLTDAQIDLLVSQWENTLHVSRDSDLAASKAVKSQQLTRSRKLDDSVRRSSQHLSSDYDSSENEAKAEAGLEYLRKSLSDAIASVNEKDGLTDQELEKKFVHLRKQALHVPKELNEELNDVRESITGVVGYAVDSGSEDFGSDGRRLGSMRIPGSRVVAKRPSSRRFEDAKYDDSDDSDDVMRYGSLSGPSFTVHKIPSADDSNDEYAAPSRRLEMVSKKDSPRRRHLSRSAEGIEDEDSYSDFTETKTSDLTSGGRSHFDAGRTTTTVDSLEQTGDRSLSSGIDMERTVDTEVSDFADHRDAHAVQRAVDDRIRAAASRQLRKDLDDDSAPFLSPPPSHQSTRHRIPSTAASSPFDGLNSDLDEGSLALSESGDTFGDLETSSRSFR